MELLLDDAPTVPALAGGEDAVIARSSPLISSRAETYAPRIGEDDVRSSVTWLSSPKRHRANRAGTRPLEVDRLVEPLQRRHEAQGPVRRRPVIRQVLVLKVRSKQPASRQQPSSDPVPVCLGHGIVDLHAAAASMDQRRLIRHGPPVERAVLRVFALQCTVGQRGIRHDCPVEVAPPLVEVDGPDVIEGVAALDREACHDARRCDRKACLEHARRGGACGRLRDVDLERRV
eukprot:1380221-Rhodomonas_salina.3